MKNKIISMALSFALVLSLSQTAKAAEENITTPTADGAYTSSVEIEADVSVPTINITLSDTAGKKVGINPYKLEYSIGSEKYTDVIPNIEETITNESNVAIAVNVTAKATIAQGSEVVVATAPLKGTETTKSVFSYLQVKTKDSADAALNTAPEYDAKSAELIAFTTRDTTKKAMVTLGAGNDSATYAGYKIFGDVASKPAKAWAATDTLNFSIVFQFEPVLADGAPN